MNLTGLELFEDLMELHKEENVTKDKYPKMRSLLERACKDLTSEENIQFSNLFSRLNYVCDKFKVSKQKKYKVNTFRINANKVLHAELTPNDCNYKIDYKSLCDVLSSFYDIPIPSEHYQIFKDYEKCPEYVIDTKENLSGKRFKRIRAIIKEIQTDYLICDFEEFPNEESYRVKINVGPAEFKGYYGNIEFESTFRNLWIGASINLIDVTESHGYFYSEFVVLEPDYLIDISSIAECHKEYGNHQLNYTISRLVTLENKMHFRIGDFANQCLDERVFETPNGKLITAETLRNHCFKAYPFEYSTCIDFNEATYNNETDSQFLNISNVISNSFKASNIIRTKATVEPSFFCEYFGIQGRLDFFQYQPEKGFYNIVELKSGKPPYPYENFTLIGKNHIVQLYLYYLTVAYNLEDTGITKDNINVYVLYSKYNGGNLRNDKLHLHGLKKIINKRNEIVLIEHFIGANTDSSNSEKLFKQITPEKLITEKVAKAFLEKYVLPEISKFTSTFSSATSELERKYFHSFYSFIAREHFISKLGDGDKDKSNRGVSSLWQNEIQDKLESGEILTDLTFEDDDNKVNQDNPSITFSIPDYSAIYDTLIFPNFRDGEIVNLYERNSEKDDVRNKQIFKGTIEKINQKDVTVRLRFKQFDKNIFNSSSRYAIEHDFLDSSYNSMYRGLYSFLHANQDRKDLLLNKRQPLQDESNYVVNIYDSIEIQQIISKAKVAKDYFLLIGPPGTGKTRIALRSMVEEFLGEPNDNILLLSYTNRAVDEICDALDSVKGNPQYIRIGSELSCERTHRKRLLDEVIRDCDNREQVRDKIKEHRIFVGTVSSVSSKAELFKLKHFQVAIVDEASQILEPSLIGILSAKNSNGGNAIDKFVLIGDHKQLPAVVLQKEDDSKVENPELQAIGLFNRRKSLFERLYSLHKTNKNSLVYGMLHKQGRMHQDIALFPNYSFYNSQLQLASASRIRQTADLEFPSFDKNNPFQKLIATKRMTFIPSEKHQADKTSKTNTYEAKIIKELLKNIFELYKTNKLKFSEDTVGIITSFRSQIALIKKEIHDLNIPELNNITVDTVERFQGSQRDIIIYSFSINQFYQLDFLSNNVEEEGHTIDRKLNVAITRAREQLFVTGNPTILSNNLIYYRFIEFIRSKSGYVKAKPEDFIMGEFMIEDADADMEVGKGVSQFDMKTDGIFNTLIIQPLKSDARTPKNDKWYEKILGNDSDFNRMNLIGFGRSDFSNNQESLFGYTLPERINLYCFYNMRKHLFTSLAIFKSYSDYFNQAITNSSKRTTFIDFGCGPLTSGLAFNQHFSQIPNFHFTYIGIDISMAMLNKAKEFSETGLFSKDSKFQFAKSLSEVKSDYLASIFTLPNIIFLNFCYLFGNLNKEETEKLANQINNLIDKYETSRFVAIYQNSALEKRNRWWEVFKKMNPRLKTATKPQIETIVYRNNIMSNFDKSETVYYEILST